MKSLFRIKTPFPPQNGHGESMLADVVLLLSLFSAADNIFFVILYFLLLFNALKIIAQHEE